MYGIKLEWIPKRQIMVDEIGDLFRGPMIPRVVKRLILFLDIIKEL